MKPWRILIFIFFVFSFLLVIVAFYPKNGIKISKNLVLQFPNIDQLDSSRLTEYPDFYSLIAPEQPPKDWRPSWEEGIDYEEINKSIPEAEPDQDINEKKAEIVGNKQKVVTDRNKNKVNNSRNKKKIDNSRNKKNIPESLWKKVPIEYGNNKLALLSFYKGLGDISGRNKLIRILHYGDSQLEEDRISALLRNKLQERFGGKGSGFFAIRELNNNSISIKHTFSNNWNNYSLFNKSDKNQGSNGFGILAQFSRFDRMNFNSSNNNEKETWIKIAKSPIAYSRCKDFENLNILFSNCRTPMMIELFENDQFRGVKSINPDTGLKIINWKFDNKPEEITINFRAEQSPDIYGISLDGSYGIALDNLAFRGNSGLGFSNINKHMIGQMFNLLNVKLIILQFGINLVKDVQSDYSNYEEKLFNNLTAFKQASPEVSILLIGISDMSRRNQGNYESYPNVKLIRNAQKRAAFRSGCAFLDMYESMGGENSMVKWVYANPPLARKDFAHFSTEGTRIVSELIYNALMDDYALFLKNINL